MSLVDRPCDYRCDIAQPQMLRVAEVREWRSARCTDHPALVARFTCRGDRQQILLR